MKPVALTIDMEKTGENIRSRMKQRGLSVRDIQESMGFENPQAVYKWLNGQTLPNLDNLMILLKVLHTGVDKIIACDDFNEERR